MKTRLPKLSHPTLGYVCLSGIPGATPRLDEILPYLPCIDLARLLAETSFNRDIQDF
jgi:hypothetical protein